MNLFRTVRVALPLAALLLAGTAGAMSGPADTLDEIASITRSSPSLFYSLDGSVLTLAGNLDDQLEERRVIAKLERLDGVSRVLSNVNTF